MEENAVEKKAYGKRPLWQWIALYVVLAIIIYGAIYYFFLNKQNSYSAQSQAPQARATQNTVYKMMPKGKLEAVMTDMKGMTLYTFAKDSKGVSNCTGSCTTAWPAYVAKSAMGNFPANISVIKRSDGTLQYAWKDMPLYYFAKDEDAGDAYGNGVGGVWSVIKE